MSFNIFLENSEFIINEKNIGCIKDKKLKKFILDLLGKDIKLRLLWDEYIKGYAKIKNELYNKNLNEIIDLTKNDALNELNTLFKLGDGYNNIIIKLTELSKEKYINESF